jgi:hypothetical protein
MKIRKMHVNKYPWELSKLLSGVQDDIISNLNRDRAVHTQTSPETPYKAHQNTVHAHKKARNTPGRGCARFDSSIEHTSVPRNERRFVR